LESLGVDEERPGSVGGISEVSATGGDGEGEVAEGGAGVIVAGEGGSLIVGGSAEVSRLTLVHKKTPSDPKMTMEIRTTRNRA